MRLKSSWAAVCALVLATALGAVGVLNLTENVANDARSLHMALGACDAVMFAVFAIVGISALVRIHHVSRRHLASASRHRLL